MSNVPLYLVLLIALTGVGCETARVGQRTTVQFGIVRNVEQVNLQSNAPAGALIGGTIGLLASSGSRAPARNALVGAAVGGGATAVAEGSRSGMSYTVEMTDGSTVRIVSDQREIHPGDCVAVERAGQTSNIRRENPAYCARDNAQAVQSVQSDSEEAAARCEAAKEELVHASTNEAIDIAHRKIDLLCNG